MGVDNRDHYYFWRCDQCIPQRVIHCDKAPMKARKQAREHRNRTTHEPYVINVTTLRVVHRYESVTLFKAPRGLEDPPF